MSEAAERDRFRGCLLGLAAGDALGTTLEFKPPGSFERFRRMRHSAQYFDPDGPAITHDDAAWAISTAQSATEGTLRISGSGGLSRFEPS